MNDAAVNAALNEVRALIKHGWCQGAEAMRGDRICDPTTKGIDAYCLSGAVKAVTGDDEELRRKVLRALVIAICKYKDEEIVWAWNDSLDQTQDEMLILVEHAIT